MIDATCVHGHQIRSRADRDSTGYCRQCRNDGARRRRQEANAALEIVRQLQAAGARFEGIA
jgi:hypothetical protein